MSSNVCLHRRCSARLRLTPAGPVAVLACDDCPAVLGVLAEPTQEAQQEFIDRGLAYGIAGIIKHEKVAA